MYATQTKNLDSKQIDSIAGEILTYISSHTEQRVTAKSVIDSLSNHAEKDDVSKALRKAIQSGAIELSEDMSLRPSNKVE